LLNYPLLDQEDYKLVSFWLSELENDMLAKAIIVVAELQLKAYR